MVGSTPAAMRRHLHLRCNAYFQHPHPRHHHTAIPLTYLLDACMHRVGRVGRVSGWARSPSAACLRTRVTPGQGIGGHSIPFEPMCIPVRDPRFRSHSPPPSPTRRHRLPTPTPMSSPHLLYPHLLPGRMAFIGLGRLGTVALAACTRARNRNTLGQGIGTSQSSRTCVCT